MSTPILELMPTHAIIRGPQDHSHYRCLCGRAAGDLAAVRLHVVQHNLKATAQA